MTRGLKLNNPFNLETTPAFTWRGEIKPTTDKGGIFAQFDTMEHGLRAGFKDLLNQQVLHGLTTWQQIITKYAPPSENDTAAYIQKLVDATGYGSNEILDLGDVDLLALAGKTVIMHEQGSNPFKDEEIAFAVKDALTQA